MQKPFARFLALAAAIASALQSGINMGSLAINPSFQYTSRGHGRGLLPSPNFLTSNSKYQPHQGKREIARRASQIESGILQVS